METTKSQQVLRDREMAWRELTGGYDFTKHRFRNSVRNANKFFRLCKDNRGTAITAIKKAQSYQRGQASYERGVADAFKHIAEHLEIDIDEL